MSKKVSPANREPPGEEDETFRLLFHNHPVPMWVYDLETLAFLEVNDAAVKKYGYTRAAFLSLTIADIRPPEDVARLLGHVKRERPDWQHSGEWRHRLKDGRIIEVEINSHTIEYHERKAVLVIAQDISERRQAEETLRESEKKYRQLYALLRRMADTMPDMLWAKNLDHEYIFTNQAICQNLLNAADTEEPLGKTDMFFATRERQSHPEDPHWHTFGELCQDSDSITLREMKPMQFDEFGNVKGKFLYLDVHKAPLYDDDGQLFGVVGSARDITAHKQAEKKLTDSEAELRALFASMQDVVLVIDREGVYRKIAPTNPALLVKPPGELLGKNLRDIFPAEQAETFLVAMRQVLETQQSVRIEYELLIGKHPTWFATSISPMDAENTVWVARDITERKQAEEKIRQMNAELEQRVEERTRELRDAQEKLIRQEKLAVMGQLAGGVGHELRNPLAVINNAAYYLKLVQPDADGKIREYLDLIERETRNAEKIITDLLDFSRVTTADREPVSVSDLVHRTLERFPVPDSVEVTLKIPDDLPPLFVDPRQMEQVLGNLTVNACQAMPQGGQLSVISRQSSVKSDALLTDSWILITVQDTGIGIPPENIKKLFEPLFTTKSRGIGLGLAVSRKLAEANGGRIEVQSEAGVGSTFTLYLPVHEEEG